MARYTATKRKEIRRPHQNAGDFSFVVTFWQQEVLERTEQESALKMVQT